jgi:hypothetical protein
MTDTAQNNRASAASPPAGEELNRGSWARTARPTSGSLDLPIINDLYSCSISDPLVRQARPGPRRDGSTMNFKPFGVGD